LINATNPISSNSSTKIPGKTVYYLERISGGNSRNWINFYMNNSNISSANDTLNEFSNLTTINMWNSTIQRRVTCNDFSCPETIFCTETNCNFNLEFGSGYEVHPNATGSPLQNNWSYVGFLIPPSNIQLTKNVTSFGLNWIGMYGNTTIGTGIQLIQNISNADAVGFWNSTTQSSVGLIPNPFPWIPTPYLNNFQIVLENGYEVSVNTSGSWNQV
jgi:hypothetical protein